MIDFVEIHHYQSAYQQEDHYEKQTEDQYLHHCYDFQRHIARHHSLAIWIDGYNLIPFYLIVHTETALEGTIYIDSLFKHLILAYRGQVLGHGRDDSHWLVFVVGSIANDTPCAIRNNQKSTLTHMAILHHLIYRYFYCSVVSFLIIPHLNKSTSSQSYSCVFAGFLRIKSYRLETLHILGYST